jgi:hypothetical protein
LVPAAAATIAPHANKSLGVVVAELAQLAQKLRPKMAAAQQQDQQQEPHAVQEGASSGSAQGIEAPEGPAPILTAVEAAAGSGAAPGADVIHSMPLKLAVVSASKSDSSLSTVYIHMVDKTMGSCALFMQPRICTANNLADLVPVDSRAPL